MKKIETNDLSPEEIQRLLEIEATAARVWRKYGRGSDWTEWRDLGEALGLIDTDSDS